MAHNWSCLNPTEGKCVVYVSLVSDFHMFFTRQIISLMKSKFAYALQNKKSHYELHLMSFEALRGETCVARVIYLSCLTASILAPLLALQGSKCHPPGKNEQEMEKESR